MSKRLTREEKEQLYRDALERAQNGHSKNDELVLMVLSEQYADVRPRENVLTFNAWRAKGRTVKQGETAFKIPVIRIKEAIDPDTGETRAFRVWGTASVFHEEQTTEYKM